MGKSEPDTNQITPNTNIDLDQSVNYFTSCNECTN